MYSWFDTCLYWGWWSTLPVSSSAHVRRLLYIRFQVEEEVGVRERVGVRLGVWRVLEVDVSHELRVVVM